MKHMLDRLSGKADDQDENSHAEAKMQVLHELRNMAMGMMGDKVKGKMPGHEMHEVDVQAPDRESLQAGLGLAQHLTGPHDSATGPKGPPSSLDAQKIKSNSNLPNLKHNGSPMDHEAGDVEDQTEQGRSEPSGDEGEPDQHMLNPNRSVESQSENGEHDADDMYDDMNHDELDQHIKHLQGLKQAKMMKR
jgi:hypothetical protein